MTTSPRYSTLSRHLARRQPGVVSAKQKVKVWRYNLNLVFKKEEQM